MRSIFRYLLLLIAVLFTFASCKKDENSEIEDVNREIFSYMKDIYLWYSHLPTSVDPAAYSDPQEYMEALRYPLYDRWSYVQTIEEQNQFDEGSTIGHGFLIGLDEFENLRVYYIYRFTQAAEAGIKRGWILTKINGTSVNFDNFRALIGESKVGVTNLLSFIDENGTPVELTLTKEKISISPVLHYEVLNQGDIKIGYMVFLFFIRPAYKDFEEVFNAFNAAGIDELVVDLRYNGGGYLSVADTLGGWLIGKENGNQPFIKLHYNAKYDQLFDKTINLPHMSNGVSLNRIFFISTDWTASASELVINGVKPYTECILAGSVTEGKPVGMNGFEVGDYIMWPVTFSYYNADDEGDFYDGIQPDLPAEDDVTRNFGDPEEASLKAVLDYIRTGIIPAKTAKSTSYRTRIIQPKNLRSPYLVTY